MFHVLDDGTNICNSSRNKKLLLVYYVVRLRQLYCLPFSLSHHNHLHSTGQGINVETAAAAEYIYSNDASETGQRTTGWTWGPLSPL